MARPSASSLSGLISSSDIVEDKKTASPARTDSPKPMTPEQQKKQNAENARFKAQQRKLK